MVYAVKQGCTLCGMCAMECPVGAITIGKQGAKIDPEKCVGCGNCAMNCASEAIVAVE
ncbi:MAG: 4Fe-4S binding protein [Eubacteriales bacterium]|nr:4Fe-4S binding protein [Eubacteriales bacterium]